jgi:hypothetical protein
MGFLQAIGYGDMFTYTKGNISADGFEVKNLSGSVMRYAVDEMVYARVMNQSRDAFGVGKGGTFTIPIFNDWGVPATVSPLVSGTSMGIGTQTTSSVSMVIKEYGTGIGYEPFGDWTTNIPIRDELVKTLGLNIGRAMNWLDKNTISDGCQFFIDVPAVGSLSAFTQDSGGTTARTRASFGELGQGALAFAYDTLKKSLVSPNSSRGFYTAIGNSRTFRNLKNGSVFQNMSLYTDMRGIKWQVLGEFMNFVFIETEELTGDGTTLVTGANAAGFGLGLAPKLWFYPDYGEDAGRMEVWKTKYYRGQGAIFMNKGTAAIAIRTCSGTFNYGLMD